MAGIAGISQPGGTISVRRSLRRIRHRGRDCKLVVERGRGTIGEVWPTAQDRHRGEILQHGVVFDGAIYNWRDLAPGAQSVHQALRRLYAQGGPSFVADLDGPFALGIATRKGLFIARDSMGIAPLYEGFVNGSRCFASEVKALLHIAEDIREFPPGHYCEPGVGLVRYRKIEKQEPMEISAGDAATGLHTHLTNAVAKRIAASDDSGSWLSGGLDSSVVAALARRQLPSLETFAVGVDGAPDLDYARLVADFIGANHHELVVGLEDMLRALPEVIYYLESFDALLVRSSIVNFLVGKLASDYVPAAFSGEGADELFAGYEYLKKLNAASLADELVDITKSLHNTALQRVDRCSAAHGLMVHTAFLDRDVVDYTLRIPPEYKLRRKRHTVEKWILRRAMDGLLPDEVLSRAKAKFWEGAGVTGMVNQHAIESICDSDFALERQLPDGNHLNTKEELFYYRIFKEHFGTLSDLSFVGRTKGAPTDE